MLTAPDLYGPRGDTLMVCLTVLVLVASLTTSSIDYSARSRDMFINYRKLQRLSVEMEETTNQKEFLVTHSDVTEMSERYQAILDESENHTLGDYLRHFSDTVDKDDVYYCTERAVFKKRKRATSIDFLITSAPYVTLGIPIAMVIPLVGSLWP